VTQDRSLNWFYVPLLPKPLKGEHIEIRDFGSFSIRHYDAYSGRNPKTGKEIMVKPKKLPFLWSGKISESL